MKVSELTGALLDYWVAKATGNGCWDWSDGTKVGFDDWQIFPSLHTSFTNHRRTVFQPSSSWLDGGPIIEREKMNVAHCDDGYGKGWVAYMPEIHHGFGPTPLIAAMRAYVASRFGDEVSE